MWFVVCSAWAKDVELGKIRVMSSIQQYEANNKEEAIGKYVIESSEDSRLDGYNMVHSPVCMGFAEAPQEIMNETKQQATTQGQNQ